MKLFIPLLFLAIASTAQAEYIGHSAEYIEMVSPLATTANLEANLVGQRLPSYMSGPIGGFVIRGTVTDSTFKCELNGYNSTTGALTYSEWVYGEKSGVQMLCDFSSKEDFFASSTNYNIVLTVPDTWYKSPPSYTVKVASTTVSYFTKGYYGVFYEEAVPPIWYVDMSTGVSGTTSPGVYQTLDVKIVTDPDNYSTILQAFERERVSTCEWSDMYCIGKKLLAELFYPSLSTALLTQAKSDVMGGTIFAFVPLAGGLWQEVFAATTTTGTASATIVIGGLNGRGETIVTLPNTAGLAGQTNIFSTIRQWITWIMYFLVVLWAGRLVLRIVGIGDNANVPVSRHHYPWSHKL